MRRVVVGVQCLVGIVAAPLALVICVVGMFGVVVQTAAEWAYDGLAAGVKVIGSEEFEEIEGEIEAD